MQTTDYQLPEEVEIVGAEFTHFYDSELPIVCSLRLGSILCQPHECKCRQDVESDGRHGLNCDEQIGRFPRHTEANMLIKRALNQIDCPSIIEVENLPD